MTNREKLNQMSNEDFANIVELVDCFKNGYKCPGMNVPDNGCRCNCKEYFIKWLEQEADGGYVIKTPTGAYYCGYNTLDPQLRKAKIYHSKRYALEAIDSLKESKCYKDIDFTLVRVKIMEDDENAGSKID